jgi:hypothetical protein
MANLAAPGLAILIDALSATFNQLMLLAIFSGLYKRFCSRFSVYVIFIILYNLITYSSARYWQDFLIDVISSSFWEIAIWYFVVKIIHFNLLSYFLIGIIDSLSSTLVDIIEHAWPIYSTTIAISILLILVPAIYVCYLWRPDVTD